MTKAPSRKPAKARGEIVAAVPRQSPAALGQRPERSPAQTLSSAVEAEVATLALDLGRMIETARQQVAHVANATLTTLYWQLGKRVHSEVLEGRRATYGAQIVAALGRQLEGVTAGGLARRTSDG
jgi:hypothetical protein